MMSGCHAPPQVAHAGNCRQIRKFAANVELSGGEQLFVAKKISMLRNVTRGFGLTQEGGSVVLYSHRV
jgi:hypothetical protein